VTLLSAALVEAPSVQPRYRCLLSHGVLGCRLVSRWPDPAVITFTGPALRRSWAPPFIELLMLEISTEDPLLAASFIKACR
jgi:hypothetical protein